MHNPGVLNPVFTSDVAAAVPRLLAIPAALARAVPHLAAFLPEWRLVPRRLAPARARLAWLATVCGENPPRGRPLLLLSEGPWRAPRFGRRWRALGLVLAESPAGLRDPVELALARPAPARAAAPPEAGAPNPARLEAGAEPGHTAAPASHEADAAPRGPALARPARRGGTATVGPDLGPLATADLAAAARAAPGFSPAALARLLAASRFADPFQARPCSAAEALALLAEWRVAEAANRGIVAATGVEVFKLHRLRARLASEAGPPPVFQRGSAALRHAAARGGSVAVWAAAMPPNLPAQAAAAGVPLVQVEDGFVRSVGLGVRLAPAQSLVLDQGGAHFDPSRPSDLERLLAEADFPPGLLARAARLRHRLVQGGVTKYNLGGAPPGFVPPEGRRVVLVCGQVADDASLLRGGGAVRTNQDLLRAARRTDPHAFLVYKPHPDVEAGMRRGAVRPEALAVMADHVAAGVPIGPLYALADEVQVMSSLAGFEALLRGRRVVCWGQPFYAGWGLTEDRAPLPRRVRRLGLDELVAAALILYPRYWDPVTGLPCSVEVLLDRLADMTAPAASRLPDWLRRGVARASGGWTAWWAGR